MVQGSENGYVEEASEYRFFLYRYVVRVCMYYLDTSVRWWVLRIFWYTTFLWRSCLFSTLYNYVLLFTDTVSYTTTLLPPAQSTTYPTTLHPLPYHLINYLPYPTLHNNRHWSLYDAMAHSPYVAAKLSVWNQQGTARLKVNKGVVGTVCGVWGVTTVHYVWEYSSCIAILFRCF